jgi:nitronate monooxygenase
VAVQEFLWPHFVIAALNPAESVIFSDSFNSFDCKIVDMNHPNTPRSLAKILGTNHAILQAPMGRSAPPELAAAVSNAGGLGMLGMSWDSSDHMRERIQRTQLLTQQPFAVNLCMQWDQSERLALALDQGIKIVSFFWGDATKYIRLAKKAKALTLHTVGNVDEAKAALDAGVDILVAQGVESGGHVRSEVATMVLVPTICDAAGRIPVIAAGGMADGRGVAAAICLGASGVWLGTRFLACVEAGAHPVYKNLLLQADAFSTVYSKLFDGGWPDAPHRVLRNSTVKQWEHAGRPASGKRPGEGDVVGQFPSGAPVPRYDDAAPMQGATGDIEAFALYAGQSVGLVHEIVPAKQILDSLVEQANSLLPTHNHF